MKIDRHIQSRFQGSVKHVKDVRFAFWCKLVMAFLSVHACCAVAGIAQQPDSSLSVGSPSVDVKTANASTPESQPQAVKMVEQVIAKLAHGAAFNARVRQRVWAAGREVVGVGTYEQAGGGTGRFNLYLTMLDGDGRHTLHQTSDGRPRLDSYSNR